MNELIFQAKYYLEDEDTSPFSLCQKLNNVPLSYHVPTGRNRASGDALCQ